MFTKKKKISFEKVMFSKSAGCFCQLIHKDDNFGVVRLPSGNYKKLPLSNFATIGINSNINYKLYHLKKAGNSRWLNRRPKVRGVAMNPIDHPHGGGEGKTSGGRPSVSAWGK
jgi:ribosomal protein L2